MMEETTKQQLVSCRLINSQRRLLDYLNEKYGEGNYEVKVSRICDMVEPSEVAQS